MTHSNSPPRSSIEKPDFTPQHFEQKRRLGNLDEEEDSSVPVRADGASLEEFRRGRQNIA
jgi:hypothetical protein